ncbi:hypothetical protein RVR_10538 [Actinacidiphila reveromycinica]|uniref:Uncharacterized protein n=1 Tax=Actinacidiphila reveromycinica TaxID=659352 RepID=A0A7U3VRV5_9ACTN|nr:hypothetical protein RVR_10538 [Streptomyces sp. SN-593]
MPSAAGSEPQAVASTLTSSRPRPPSSSSVAVQGTGLAPPHPWSVTSSRTAEPTSRSAHVICRLSVCRTALVNSSVTTRPASSLSSASAPHSRSRARIRARASATDALIAGNRKTSWRVQARTSARCPGRRA